MRHRISHILFFLAFAWSLLGLVSAAPAPVSSSRETVYRRQAVGKPLTRPEEVTTVQTINTPSGIVTETCVITFTPVIGKNGEPLVQVVRQCTIVPGDQSSGNQTPPSISTGSSSLSSTAPPSSTSSPPPASSSPPPNGASVLGFTSVSIPATTNTPPPNTPSPTPATTPDSNSSASSNMSAAADNTTASPSSSAAAAFQIPGKKISVLPIGLGIFAGISVIALIVVGLVTYERTKYRKIFRQRKLAEQGSGMGYS
ncbi:hypothetical protein BGY98DRAFT_327586 [Russula aff. rugulosa BPL654]|nr:hypothetical protein BGY98DRAFT_327586 [Russula aff. rugulosa BPL654]